MKKTYISPAIDMIVILPSTSILAGSEGGVTTGSEPGDEVVDGPDYARFWDDEEDEDF